MCYVLFKCRAGPRGLRPIASVHGRVCFRKEDRAEVQAPDSNPAQPISRLPFIGSSAAAPGGFQTRSAAFLFIPFLPKHQASAIDHL